MLQNLSETHTHTHTFTHPRWDFGWNNPCVLGGEFLRIRNDFVRNYQGLTKPNGLRDEVPKDRSGCVLQQVPVSGVRGTPYLKGPIFMAYFMAYWGIILSNISKGPVLGAHPPSWHLHQTFSMNESWACLGLVQKTSGFFVGVDLWWLLPNGF